MWEGRLGSMTDGCVMLIVSGLVFFINPTSSSDCRAETLGPGPHGSEGPAVIHLGGRGRDSCVVTTSCRTSATAGSTRLEKATESGRIG
ncbi:hypothetical protein GQ607_003646 [Colletotrichum asianum]|uniref:Secreted protein n=1 Tax=Colletotrichum asianum TaxID=702518 RepID=A0A8H3WJ26_9PEZI|nr:hypothetical protein GQ607_003646 [Colletotrichum asianum]